MRKAEQREWKKKLETIFKKVKETLKWLSALINNAFHIISIPVQLPASAFFDLLSSNFT